MRKKINVTQEKREYNKWNVVKKDIHIAANIPKIAEGEIWWYACGKNVGVEINGKNANFTRPVLILKKLSALGFIGLPLTSQPHKGPWYAHFKMGERDEIAVLAQIKTLSSYRLYRKMGEVDRRTLRKVNRKLRRFLRKNTPQR